MSASYTTGASASGRVSGRDTGVYHYFQSGRKITLTLTQATSSSGAVAILYRKTNPVSILDAYYGQVSTVGVGSKTFPTKTNATSGGYYLIFAGGHACTTIKLSGSIHD